MSSQLPFIDPEGGSGVEKLTVGSGLYSSNGGGMSRGSHLGIDSIEEAEVCEDGEVQPSQPVLASLSTQLPLS